ncbi:hypothetical protein [Bacteroidetes bacterium endosymbiont of Geopemphigus sp.]|uniref:hypothetical protein n=1 Tax=Bacteroidetes bacterium endosymbiont of Geopemphigus sp. TaxID=2047937 RepID=UPI000CD159DD|nr:hypothetical protein [Bacteroidetes bacterium endosymbiont of Geopemphigus sp.]
MSLHLRKQVDLILKAKGGIKAKASNGFNLLHLIKKDADVNAKNNYGHNPLHWAASIGKEQTEKNKR